MSEPSSSPDDTSVASSGDELLNSAPLFSEDSAKTSRGKRENTEIDGGEPTDSLRTKRKLDDITDGFGADDKAGEKARKAFKEEFGDHQKIGTPDKLFWHEKSKKGKKMIHPVRVVRREEVVGIHLHWDDATHSGINFLYSQKKGGEGTYGIASHRSLSPYHGEGEKDRWCPRKLEQYSKQLKKNQKLNATDLEIEEAFLRCALQKSISEGEQAEKLKSIDEVVSEDNFPHLDVDVAEHNESEEEEESQRGGRRTPRRSAGVPKNTEPLRVGDHIEFYAQQSTGGDRRALRTAEILYIDPKGNGGQPLLMLDDPMTDLQPEHVVKRVKRRHYGKLLDNDRGVFRPIDEYVLKKEGDSDARSKMLARMSAAAKEKIRRKKAETLANMERDGFSRSLAKDALCL